MQLQKNSHWLFQLLIVVLTVGCGESAKNPPLGQVTGTVTMDGKPLANAEVSFYPDSGRASVGMTNASGKFDLFYVEKVHGAVVGQHTVRITTFVEEQDSPAASDFKETIPKKYNEESQLKETVKAGRNDFKFALESQ